MRPLKIYFPSADLAPYIQYYMFSNIGESLLARDDFEGLRVMPCTFPSMVLFFTEPSYKEVEGRRVQLYNFGIAGFNTSPKNYLRNTELKQMIICFTPTGMQQLLDFPLKEITDSHAPVKDVFKRHFELLLNELNSTHSNRTRIEIFETVLRREVSRLKPVDERVRPLVRYIFKSRGTSGIRQASEQLNIGERTIQRLIQRYVGINFKFFSRLVRFRSARILLADSTPQSKLTEIGCRLNYTDQAHFIHDFQKLSGHAPGDFIRLRRLKTSVASNPDNEIDTFI